MIPVYLPDIANDTKDRRLTHPARKANLECLNTYITADDTQWVPIGTPLHDAAEEGLRSRVQSQLAEGADRHLPNQDGKTPLLVALSCTKQVVQGAGFVVDIPSVDLYIVSMLLDPGQDTIADLALLESFRIDAVNALLYAAELSSPYILSGVLGSGVDINSRGYMQSTALHGAVRVAGSAEAQEVIALLLGKGSDVNAKDEEGRTPLFFTCALAVTQLLLQHGALVGEVDRDGRTALDHVLDCKSLAEWGSIVAALQTSGSLGVVTMGNTGRQDSL